MNELRAALGEFHAFTEYAMRSTATITAAHSHHARTVGFNRGSQLCAALS